MSGKRIHSNHFYVLDSNLKNACVCFCQISFAKIFRKCFFFNGNNVSKKKGKKHKNYLIVLKNMHNTVLPYCTRGKNRILEITKFYFINFFSEIQSLIIKYYRYFLTVKCFVFLFFQTLFRLENNTISTNFAKKIN